jgi:hypothetical protein
MTPIFTPAPGRESPWNRRDEKEDHAYRANRASTQASCLARRWVRASPEKGGGRGVEGYCVKCRAKKEIKDAKAVTMKNGRPATEGSCPTCGTKIFKIGKAS